MKKVLKFAGSLIIGMCMGAAGVILGISWFTGTSLTAFLEHLKIETLLSSMFISLISLFIAGYLQSGSYSYALRLGTACGSATAFSLGLAERRDIDALLKTIE